MEVTSRADLWGCRHVDMVTNQLFCSLISWLVSTSWLDIQYPQSMFFHECKTEKWPSFTTFLKICKHVLQFIISARALTKVFVLVLCSWPPQHHLFSRLTVIPMSNTRWFLTSVRPDLKTDALQTWTSQIFLAGFLSLLVTSGRCAMWRKTQLRSVFLHWTAQCGQSGHCLKILAAKMTVLLINTSSGYSFCRRRKRANSCLAVHQLLRSAAAWCPNCTISCVCERALNVTKGSGTGARGAQRPL